MVDQSSDSSKGSSRETVTIERGALGKGDRMTELGNGMAVLQRANREWWCVCKHKHWDCDIGPDGDVWCVEKCLKYECTPMDNANLSSLLMGDQ